jgi:hypothetical protein
MKIAIMEIYPIKKVDFNKHIDAHLRNAMQLQQNLGADLLITEQDYLRAMKRKYDILMLMYSTHYAPFKVIEAFLNQNVGAVRVRVTNEYNHTSSINCFSRVSYHILSNYETPNVRARVLSWTCMNLNLLLSQPANPMTEKNFDCIYYGTFRKDRALYFDRYLQKPIYLSTSSKNQKKYWELGVRPHYLDKLKWAPRRETLNQFRYSLYIEDMYTHVNFNNLANRWYEAGMCNNVVFFDRSCLNTLRKSEISNYDYDFYLVNSHDELIAKIDKCNKNFEKHLGIQKTWRLKEPVLKEKLFDDIRNYCHALLKN